MARKLGTLTFVIVTAIAALAAGSPGNISGYVRNSSGTPQMGATVEVFASSLSPVAKAFTDAKGFYSVAGVSPGLYDVKVTAPLFLPALREDVSLKAGAHAVVNVTLNTLFEALQMPPTRPRTAQAGEDWKWTLRSTANRPLLRLVEGSPLVVVSKGDKGDERVLKGRIAFMAGSDSGGFGSSSDIGTAFTVERSLFSSGTLSFNGNVGYNETAAPATVVRAAYSHKLASGSEPQIAVTARRFAVPEIVAHNAALQALAVSVSDTLPLTPFMDINLGTEYQTIQFLGRAAALRPYGSLDVHLSPNTVLEYRYASSEPNSRAAKGFDSAPADLSESGPRVSLNGFAPVIEDARHHEISVSRRLGNNNIQVAFYADRIGNPALLGVGDVNTASGDFLPDVYAGTFTYTGHDLDSGGLRVVYGRMLAPGLSATINYSYGGVIELTQPDVGVADLQSATGIRKRHALTWKMSGTVPNWKTKWIASYKWTSGGESLIPVDLFNVSAGQADPYLSIFIRQPLPGIGFMPDHMEMLIDIRNLLAQGYVPVMGQDGHTLYLVQSARAVRGGVAFTF
ncbi:MAG: carboxypeptidase-like regulatory domain-containing protein [Terriglobales bacterium]